MKIKNQTSYNIAATATEKTAEPVVQRDEEKSTEHNTFINKVKKSLLFILPVLVIYFLYYKVGPTIVLRRFSEMSPPAAGLLAAGLFMPFVGLFWYMVSHIWPAYDMKKSMWIFTIILAVVSGTDYYFYRQAHPEKYASATTATATPAVYQITPQVLEGWLMKDGCLTVNLQPGQEVARTFQLGNGYSTPCIIIPEDEYRVRFDHNQTIILDDGTTKVIVHPGEKYSGGVTPGERRIKFTALEGGADLILAIKRLEQNNKKEL